MMFRRFKTVLGGALIGGLTVLLFAGCTASRVEWDKAALLEVKKVAVVLYTVPVTIDYRDDPQKPRKKGLQILASAANVNNGPHAATLAQRSFIDQLNKSDLRFKAMTQAEMMGNSAFRALANKELAAKAEQMAKAAAEKAKDTSSANKVLGFLSSMNKAAGANPDNEGAAPEGMPEFGLAANWSNAPSALMGTPGEIEYVKAAIAALGVDAALVVNDPGMSFGCQACIGGTGTGTTGAAFVATMVDKDGQPILQMRQWFALGGTSAMVAYIINPLQHDSLFESHGVKMAEVFNGYYREEGGK